LGPKNTIGAAVVSPSLWTEHLSARWSSSSPECLTDVSLSVKAGELVGVVGPVGGGKVSQPHPIPPTRDPS
jgi:ABC-type bacteriocin/lantibiotic exporter with double-glycine peptidase domain